MLNNDNTQGNNQKAAPDASSQDSANASSSPLPSISLPKGGGAIRGIGEKFAANPVTGTGSMTVPIATSPGRSGFGPQLSLSYDSGAGNGPFGFGWSMSVPSITRKTDKGLPRYCDGDESDVFILSGAEDLVPILDATGQRMHVVPPRTVHGITYEIWFYRPRIEGLFARIERWTATDTGVSHWRSISRDNVTTLYGYDANSCVTDPSDPRNIFSYHICRTWDDKGNVTVYDYLPEDGTGVDHAQAHEANRTDGINGTRTTQRYLKTILYGNVQPYFPDWTSDGTETPLPIEWLFKVVLDYGDHDPGAPTPMHDRLWPVRPDPFSVYRSCFEVRSYRRVERILVFNNFTAENGVGADCLVRSTDLVYSDQQNPADPHNPIYTFLVSLTQTGYLRNGNSYTSRSLPPLEFEYSQPQIQPDVLSLDPDSLANLPEGINGSHLQWIDLDGEGLPGILTDVGSAWYYKRNLSPINQVPQPDGSIATRANFGPLELVAVLPSRSALGNTQQFLDLSGGGRLDLVDFNEPLPGYFKRTSDENWEPFHWFASLPNVDWSEPNLKFVDLTGDGIADILFTEDGLFTLYPSLGDAGFDQAQVVRTPWDEEKGPKVVLADGTQTIFLADMSGDGLSDLARVRNGETCYWPNLGYGRFGAKVTMDGAPRFIDEERFDPRRIRLADIDGSGTTDLLYIGADGILVCFNQSGNSWAAPTRIAVFPSADSESAVQVHDLLGTGTACLVWSSPLPGESASPLRYVDLMGGQKPHLMVLARNNLGAETRVTYTPSTRFYLADKVAGRPWITRLHFPVQVVERVETSDDISHNRFVTRYAYHHGYFDGYEREFRGFGMVEQWDTDELAVLTASGALPAPTNEDDASYVPPVYTRTWFHTGFFFGRQRISRSFEQEYYHESDLTLTQQEAMLLDDTVLPDTLRLADGTSQPIQLSAYEVQEACRALKGSLLRQEVYALDSTDAQSEINALDSTDAQSRPYSVSERNYTLEFLQPLGGNRHAVFFSHARETLDVHYERALFEVNDQQLADPRVNHTVTLAVDYFGNVQQSVTIAYGRRYDDLDSLLTDNDRQQQKHPQLMYTENQYTNAIPLDDAYRVPFLCDTRRYELIHVTPAANLPPANQPQVTNLFRFTTLAGNVQAASDGKHDLPYEDIDAAGAVTDAPYRRLLEQSRSLYRRDDLGGPLPLGQVQTLALPFENYKLALTPGLVSGVFQRQSGGAVEALLPDPVSVLGNEGRYARSNDLIAAGSFPASDPAEHWWLPAGQTFYSPSPGDGAAQELAYAQQHFFLPQRFLDPFEQTTTITYDSYDLLLQETLDPLGNRVTAGERAVDGRLTSKGNDYRVLQPALVMDPNRNRSAVAFDTLGMVVGTALMGKPEEKLGNTLDGFDPDLTPAVIAVHLQDPLTDPYSLLSHATTRLVYDLFAYQRTQADPQPQPAVVYTMARETHDADLPPGQQTKVQHHFSYSDGFGREIQKKSQAEPGALVDGGPVSNPRWVGSGWTIFNNKGKPVRQYEPFFSATHTFEFAMTVGVSPILFYDPVERVVATLHPNHSYEKVVFDPWRQETYDVNDTVAANGSETGDPRTDAVIKGYVAEYFKSQPNTWQTWYQQRIMRAIGAQEKSAAEKASVHADTPTIAYFDTLGHTFLTIAHNRFVPNSTPAGLPVDEYYATRSTLDIQGLQRAVSDAHSRVVMRYDYDLLGNHIHQASMEAGERWMLNDVAGKPIYAWDSHGNTLHTVYDELRRPVEVHLEDSTGSKWLVGRTIYGEAQSGPEAQNLRCKVYQAYDQAGLVTTDSYDFKGNLLQSSRQLASEYQKNLDWSLTGLLDPQQVYTNSTTYDALNRPIQFIAPHSTNTSANINILQPVYNEANLLEALNVWTGQTGEPNQLLDPTTANLMAVKNLDYNAKGQRTLIEYGNGAQTQYEYDPQTFRLTHLFTSRGSAFPGDGTNPSNPPAGVQNLGYTYDPTGNITFIQDDAQQTIYFRNRQVEPSADYIYDAVYRLISARGREHLGQVAGRSTQAPIPMSYDDGPRMGIVQPGDGNAMGSYLQQYTYDEVGNLLQMLHSGTDPVNPGWTRTYSYKEPSQLEAGKVSNRLTSTQISDGLFEPYTYDLHGNMTSMPSLPLMQWDYNDQLQATAQQVKNNGGTPETTYYVYDSQGQRVRKVTERHAASGQSPTRLQERIYLGSFEIYREYSGGGNTVALERETLHVMDDKQRVALIETRTVGTDPGEAQLIRYQYANHLGSAALELDDRSQIISYEEYYPYGSTSYQAVRSKTETPKRYRYTGKERDEESGLYYHGARYYACWLGRWTSCDPKGMVDGVSVYVYVRNNPVNITDPTGKEGFWDKAKNFGNAVFELKTGFEEALTNVPMGILIEGVARGSRAVQEISTHPGTYAAGAIINPTQAFAQASLVAEIKNVNSKLSKATKDAGGGPMGAFVAVNQLFNPAYKAIESGQKSIRAFQEGKYHEASKEYTNTGLHIAETLALAEGGARLTAGLVGEANIRTGLKDSVKTGALKPAGGIPSGEVGSKIVTNPTEGPITDPARLLPQRAGPTGQISPSEVVNRTPGEIHLRAQELGLKPMGPDPAMGKGSYIDPQTGIQRMLSHPDSPPFPHGHVNNLRRATYRCK